MIFSEKQIELLKEFGGDCYWHGENTGDYDCADIDSTLLADLSKQWEKTTGWISVEDRLPDKNGYYLVYCGMNHITVTFFTAENISGPEFSGDPTVTHWMPLPQAPVYGYS